MKKTKFLASLLAVAMMLFLLPANAVNVSAAEPITYALQYVESADSWCFQSGTSVFDVNEFHSSCFYLLDHLKDGDAVVVYNPTGSNVPELNLGTVKLSNLTIVNTSSHLIVYTGGVDEFFALAGTSVSVNGNVNTASVYDDLICNFNGNVGTLNFYVDGEINSTIGVGGTVGHLYGYNEGESRVYYDFYNFKPNTLIIIDGGFRTPEENFSRTPGTVQNPVTATPAPAPSTGSSSSEYDDVPKTGDSFMALYLLLAAFGCAGASYCLKKKA